jgi:hypothetical protein
MAGSIARNAATRAAIARAGAILTAEDFFSLPTVASQARFLDSRRVGTQRAEAPRPQATQLQQLGYEPIEDSPDQFAAEILGDIERFGGIVKAVGMDVRP